MDNVCGAGGNKGNKTTKLLIIILSVMLLLGVITLFFSSHSNATKIKPEMENNVSSNASTANNTQNTAAKNSISFRLEKPPFIKD